MGLDAHTSIRSTRTFSVIGARAICCPADSVAMSPDATVDRGWAVHPPRKKKIPAAHAIGTSDGVFIFKLAVKFEARLPKGGRPAASFNGPHRVYRWQVKSPWCP